MSFCEASVKLECGGETVKAAVVEASEVTELDPETTLAESNAKGGNDKAEGKAKVAEERRSDGDLFRSKFGPLKGATCARLPGWVVDTRPYGKFYIDPSGRKFALIKDIEAHFGKRLRDQPDEPIQEVEEAMSASSVDPAAQDSPMPSASAEPTADPGDFEAATDTGPSPKPIARGYARGPEQHYVHQVQGVLEATGLGAHDFEVFLGRLGTGIIGVRPRAAKAASPSHPSASPSPTASTTAAAAPPNTPQPEDRAAIVLFVNLSAAVMQWRDTHAIGGYSAMVSVKTRTLTWQSQWIDKKSKTARQVVDWAARGGRVEVFVRTKVSSAFVRLGDVASAKLALEAGCLVQPGAEVLQEKGSGMVHRAITAKCLTPAMMAGVGLSATKYSGTGVSRCAHCCFTPAEVAITFRTFSKAGLAEYRSLSEPEHLRAKSHKWAKGSPSKAAATKKRVLTKLEPEEAHTPLVKRRITGKVKIELSEDKAPNPRKETTWRYQPFDNKDINLDVREQPSLISGGTGISLKPKQTFQVVEERRGDDDGIMWLRLADCSGWVGDKTVNGQMMCMAVEGAATPHQDLPSVLPLAVKCEPSPIIGAAG